MKMAKHLIKMGACEGIPSAKKHDYNYGVSLFKICFCQEIKEVISELKKKIMIRNTHSLKK